MWSRYHSTQSSHIILQSEMRFQSVNNKKKRVRNEEEEQWLEMKRRYLEVARNEVLDAHSFERVSRHFELCHLPEDLSFPDRRLAPFGDKCGPKSLPGCLTTLRTLQQPELQRV